MLVWPLESVVRTPAPGTTSEAEVPYCVTVFVADVEVSRESWTTLLATPRSVEVLRTGVSTGA